MYWAGFVPTDAQNEDKVVCFYGSNIVLVTRGKQQTVIGRTLLLQPNFQAYQISYFYYVVKDVDIIILLLEEWRRLTW